MRKICKVNCDDNELETPNCYMSGGSPAPSSSLESAFLYEKKKKKKRKQNQRLKHAHIKLTWQHCDERMLAITPLHLKGGR
jgi:hypothetical protein